ncbi:hypothetical protein V6N13_070426 [Hibiscus sabdariffa]
MLLSMPAVGPVDPVQVVAVACDEKVLCKPKTKRCTQHGYSFIFASKLGSYVASQSMVRSGVICRTEARAMLWDLGIWSKVLCEISTGIFR